MIYLWWEDDPGEAGNSETISYDGVTHTITYEDDYMGFNVVHFNDPYNMYTTGDIEWYSDWEDRCDQM